MSIDMSQFNETYLEEASEHLSDLENALLHAEDTGEADVDAIFRAAHSIKGGAGTFGFTEIAEFTHVVEHIFQEARDGVIELNQENITILLKAVDVVSDMVTAAREDREVGDVGQDQVIKELNQISNSAAKSSGNPGKATSSHMRDGESFLEIKFKPHLHMAQTGSDPVNIITELSEIGDISVEADLSDLPSLEDMDPHNLYLGWNIHLETTATEDVVREAFIFVEDEADIDINIIAGIDEITEQTEQPEAATEVDAKKEEPEKTVLSATPMEDRRAADRRAKPDRRQEQPQPKESTVIRVSVDKVDSLINLVGELVTSNAMVQQQTNIVDCEENQQLCDALAQMTAHTRQLQEGIMAIRMMPIDFAFSRFPRMVRDTAKKLGKVVNLETIGGQTELDKTVIEKIADPLTHLVRNAIDHGLESAEERVSIDKTPDGTVTLKAYYKGGNVMIEVLDDGKGLDKERILNKAIEKGLASPDSTYTDDEIFQFIFSSGFSTAETLSDVSGRGVGMDVVYKNIKSLGGSIQIQSQKNVGTSFVIGLPLTLAIVDGMAIKSGAETYIVPLLNIIESIRLNSGQIQRMKNNVEVINVRGEYLPLLRIRQALPVQNMAPELPVEDSIAIVVESEQNKIALLVDDLLGERQVVIKSLEDNYKDVEGISGATILGDGGIALILDLAGLVRISRRDGRYNTNANHTAHLNQVSSINNTNGV